MSKLTKHATGKALIALLATAPGLALAAGDGCSLQTLKGSYIFSASGFTIVSGVALPKTIVELIDFSGDGTLFSPGGTRSINGDVVPTAPGPGVYTLDADCRGTLTFTPGPHFDIYVTSSKEVTMMQTDQNNVFQGTVKVFRR